MTTEEKTLAEAIARVDNARRIGMAPHSSDVFELQKAARAHLTQLQALPGDKSLALDVWKSHPPEDGNYDWSEWGKAILKHDATVRRALQSPDVGEKVRELLEKADKLYDYQDVQEYIKEARALLEAAPSDGVDKSPKG